MQSSHKTTQHIEQLCTQHIHNCIFFSRRKRKQTYLFRISSFLSSSSIVFKVERACVSIPLHYIVVRRTLTRLPLLPLSASLSSVFRYPSNPTHGIKFHVDSTIRRGNLKNSSIWWFIHAENPALICWLAGRASKSRKVCNLGPRSSEREKNFSQFCVSDSRP